MHDFLSEQLHWALLVALLIIAPEKDLVAGSVLTDLEVRLDNRCMADRTCVIFNSMGK